jgi:WD40 repeat protein
VGAVTSVWFDEQRLVSGSADGTVKVWDLAQGICVYTEVVGARVDAVAGDATRLAVGAADGRLRLYAQPSWHGRVLAGHEAGVKAVHLAGGRVFSGGRDGTVKVWSPLPPP